MAIKRRAASPRTRVAAAPWRQSLPTSASGRGEMKVRSGGRTGRVRSRGLPTPGGTQTGGVLLGLTGGNKKETPALGPKSATDSSLPTQ